MLAQQRKADFAAAARGEPAALAAPPSAGSLAAAGGALPFYLRPGAYAATSLRRRSSFESVDSPTAPLQDKAPQEASPLEPRPPGAAEAGGRPARTAVPRAGSKAEAAPSADGTPLIAMPSGEVGMPRGGARVAARRLRCWQACSYLPVLFTALLQYCSLNGAAQLLRWLSPSFPPQVTLGLPPAAPHGHRWDCELGTTGLRVGSLASSQMLSVKAA